MAPKKRPPVILESTITQDIAEMQLMRLKEIAMNRMLTLEECKQLDLLNKNLLLALGHASIIVDAPNAERLPTEDLVLLASSEDVNLSSAIADLAAKPDPEGANGGS